jgi:hypothetical protein
MELNESGDSIHMILWTRAPQKKGNSLTSCATINFSLRTLLQAVNYLLINVQFEYETFKRNFNKGNGSFTQAQTLIYIYTF